MNTPNKNTDTLISPETLQKWKDAAWDLPQVRDKVPVPFDTLMGEAVDVAKFCKKYWEPRIHERGKDDRPGLKGAVGNGLFTENTGTEIFELHRALQVVHTDYRYQSSLPGHGPMERAQFILSELRDTLGWFYDDGVEDDNDARLATLAKAHDGAMSQDAVAAALYDYAEVADRNREAVGRLGAFDVSLIEEAREVAVALRDRPAIPGGAEKTEAQREAMELRNRIATLLYERMQRARAAGRYVFRNHPELIREVTSAYVRRQRANHRNAVADAALAPTEPGVAPAPAPAPGVTAIA